MSILYEELKNWNEERARVVMEQRKLQATTGSGNICIPSNAGAPYFPFNHMQYPYQILTSPLTSGPWEQVLGTPPDQLIPVDPFAPSLYRAGGLQVWDAAVGIPASTLRADRVLKTRMIPGVRNTNNLWAQTLTAALGRVGPLGKNGAFIRPQGPFIVDLMNHPLGWKILDGAHALAHRVGETKSREFKKTVYHAGRTHFHMQRFVFQLVTCMLYGLPFDAWCLDDGKPGEPDIPQYGIEFKPSSYFRAPILRVPVANSEAPHPDKAIAFVDGGVFIEPHPHGFTSASDKWKEVNCWSCSPTMVVIAGWELIDVVSHFNLCSTYPDDPRDTVCYGMNPIDLQPPDTFWAYLWYGVKHRGVPAVDNKRFWHVEDWVDSDDYKRAIAESPPLPCYDCLRINMKTEGAPMRPLSRPPEPLTPEEKRRLARGRLRLTPAQLEWKEWDARLHDILRIVEQAVIYKESRTIGRTAAMHIRHLRMANYRKRLECLRQIQQLTKAVEKAKKDGVPSRIPDLIAQRQALIVAANSQVGGHV